jgi:hypothetical protein
VRIDPIDMRGHADGLRAAAADGELWTLWYTSVPIARRDTDAYVANALELARPQGRDFALVVHDAAGVIVGSARVTVQPVEAAHNRRLEIGYTWYAQRVQRSAAEHGNQASAAGACVRDGSACIAVEFRTHWFNQRSRAAIAAPGREAGRRVAQPPCACRTAASATRWCSPSSRSEWPAVKQGHLDYRLATGAAS